METEGHNKRPVACTQAFFLGGGGGGGEHPIWKASAAGDGLW